MRKQFGKWSCFALFVLVAGNACSAIAASTPLQLVTIGASETPSVTAGGDSGLPIITPDGRYVLFASTANNLVAIANHLPIRASFPAKLNVFLRDRTNQTTTLVSVNFTGVAGANEDSLPVGVSTNGRFAMFESSASDLVANDTNKTSDVFIRDIVNGTTILVSVSTNGCVGNGPSRSATMTPDGRYVAFVSAASNLVANDVNGIPDVFVRDLQTGGTTLASAGAVSVLGSGSSESPDIAPDGSYVAFYSSASNLVEGVTSTSDIYVRDLRFGFTFWASADARTLLLAAQGSSQGICYNHTLSADGGFVAFECKKDTSSAVPGLILRYSLVNDSTDLVNTNGSSATGNYQDVRTLDMTPDGRFIAFIGNGSSPSTHINVWDAQTGTTALASCDVSNAAPSTSFCSSPVLDPSGRFVAFVADTTNLVANPVVSGNHLYLRDMQAGVTQLVDADIEGRGRATAFGAPCLAAEGVVAFACGDGLNPNDGNRFLDVFVRNTVAKTTELISLHHPQVPSTSPNGPSECYDLSISADGRYVAFSSFANNLVVNDTNSCRDIFVRDLLAATNLLVSVASDGLTLANASSADLMISPDGRYVAFSSWANNLVTGDLNAAQDVFVRDLLAGTTTLVSVKSSGTGSAGLSSTPLAIGLGGKYVLFSSSATDLAPTTSGNNLFVRDMVGAKTYALTTSGYYSSASTTPDGRFIAHQAGNYSTQTLYVWDSLLAKRVYTNSTASITGFALSPDGNRIVYCLNGTSLWLVDRAARTERSIVSGISSGRLGRFSQDGRYLLYRKYQGGFQICLYDFETGSNRLISKSDSGVAGSGFSDNASFGFSNRFIAYSSTSTNLVPTATNDMPNIFLYDRQTDGTTLLSTSQFDGLASQDRAFAPVFSADGKTLVFGSCASDLTAQDSNQAGDIFAFTILCAEIVPGTIPGQDLSIQWLAVPGKTNLVQYKNSLDDPEWRDISGNVTTQGNRRALQDAGAASARRFYRVIAK